MARGYDVGRPESRVECEVPPARRKHPPSDHHPPPTPKMGLEERSPSPRPSPPGEGEARTVPGILTPFGVELLQGTRVGDCHQRSALRHLRAGGFEDSALALGQALDAMRGDFVEDRIDFLADKI